MEYSWKETKRILGMPISFTKYGLGDGRLFRRAGILTRKEDQISLYHIRDFEVRITLGQRIFGVGTVKVIGVDKSTPELLLENIKHPYEVRDFLYREVENECQKRNMRYSEHIELGDDCDHDYDNDAQ